MQHDELAAEQRILAQCSGLHSWLRGPDEREPARERVHRELGDRLFALIVGGLGPRRDRLTV
jgi:hypothetical protein